MMMDSANAIVVDLHFGKPPPSRAKWGHGIFSLQASCDYRVPFPAVSPSLLHSVLGRRVQDYVEVIRYEHRAKRSNNDASDPPHRREECDVNAGQDAENTEPESKNEIAFLRRRRQLADL